MYIMRCIAICFLCVIVSEKERDWAHRLSCAVSSFLQFSYEISYDVHEFACLHKIFNLKKAPEWLAPSYISNTFIYIHVERDIYIDIHIYI